MKAILVTGGDGFLGYHVLKLLHEQGFKPRALFRAGKNTKTANALKSLNVDHVEGDVEDLRALRAACDGIDTILHMSFALALGSGAAAERTLREGNLVGTRNVLGTAAQAGAARVVLGSSVLTIGINGEPKPLDESADWDKYHFDLPYALSRRMAEQEALALPARDGAPAVVAVNPSFTMGPDDFDDRVPANKVVKAMPRFFFGISMPVGFGILDARDFAEGVVAAATRGRHGRRYILSGENLTLDTLLSEVAAAAGTRPPRASLPLKRWMVQPLLAVYEKASKGKVASSLLQLWDHYAWYDASLARAELGWKARSLRETLRDTLDWRPPSQP